MNIGEYKKLTKKTERKNKYNVSIISDRTMDGICFHSRAEMLYYAELKLEVRQGFIKYFHRQVPFDLPGGVRYVCDFMIVYPDGKIKYIEVKGKKRPEYIIKKKQVEALYPVEIIEVEAYKRK